MRTERIKWNIRIGIRNKKAGFSSTENKAATETQAALVGAMARLAEHAVIDRMDDLPAAVTAAVHQSLTTFAWTCSTYFFSLKANTSAAFISERTRKGAIRSFHEKTPVAGVYAPPLRVDLSPLGEGTLGPTSVLWPGLAASTLAKKRRKGGEGSDTYFVYDSVLKGQMEAAFKDDVLLKMFAPTVTITTNSVRSAAGAFTRGQNIASIKVRLFKRQGDARALLTGEWSGAREDLPVITRYLQADMARKLLNFGRGGERVQRPWVGPAIAFWVLNMAPKVVAQAVMDTVKPPVVKPKRGRYRGADLGGL